MVLPVAALMMGMGIKRKLDQNAQEDEDRATKIQRDTEDRAYTVGQRERTLREQGEADALTASMRNVAKPATVDANMVMDPSSDNRDVGEPGAAPNTQQGYRVNGKVYADQPAATAAATEYNAPAATMRRQAQVLSGAGKTGDAVELTKRASEFEANEALKQAGSLLMNGGWASVPEVYARYQDGRGAKVVEDGKGGATVITYDEATGKETGRREFKDLPHLFASIAGRFDPTKWVADEQRRNTEAEGTRRWEAEQGVREKNADSSALLKSAQADAASARATASMTAAQAALERAQRGAAGADPKAATPDATFDENTAADIAKDIVKKEAEDASVGGKPMTAAQIAARKDAIVETLRATHTNRFIVSNVSRVLTVAQNDPVAYAQEYGKALKVMPQSELARLGFKPPAGAGAPAAPAAGATAAAPRQPATAPAPAAAPAAPAPVNTAGNDQVLQQIDAKNKAALDGLAAQVTTAKQQLAAVTKSGDPQALAVYARAVTDATEKLKAEAAKRLGNGAPAYLQSLAL